MKRSSIKSTLLALAISALAVSPGLAQMNYQGRLTDSSGNNLTPGQYTIEFRLFDEAGAEKWGPFTTDGTAGNGKGPQVDLVDGRFNTVIGNLDAGGRALSIAFNGADKRFLQIKVGNNPPITPRQLLLPAPIAHYAVKADTVSDGAIGTAQLADGSVTAAKLNGATGVWLSSGANIYHGAGNVGIGNTNPTNKLDVTGNIRATGTFTGSGAGLTDIDIANLAAAVKQALCPVGTILPYAGDTAPVGWLLCNGFAYRKTDFPILSGLIGERFGNNGGGAAGGAVFQVPDFRGRFLRGRDGGIARDPDRASRTAMASGGATGDAVGSVQGHAFQSHTHGQNQVTGTGRGSGSNFVLVGTVAGQTDPSGTSTETRPVNAYVNYIIKY